MDLELFDARPKVKKPNRLPQNPEEGGGRFPSWLHRKLPKGKVFTETNQTLSRHGLNTVCEEAKCPNRFECYSKKTATFLVLGKECTRQCGFCDIDFAKQPKQPDPKEPNKIAACVKDLGLKHVVITMVARDDLSDGGASQIRAIVEAIRERVTGTTIELLTSDFDGNMNALDEVLKAPVEVFNHNIETVRRLSSRVRHRAEYERTLEVLRYVSENTNGYVKSGIMVGLGETEEEVKETIEDLHNVGCDIITIGQYLQASRNKLNVKEFVTPEQFKAYEEYGQTLGVMHMYCGPFVRSSYNADLLVKDGR